MKRTFLFKSIAAISLMTASSLTMAQSAPVNNLDCTEEEVMSYASKDNYEEPLGISVMPSVQEYKPAYTMQENKENEDLSAAERGCPTIIPEGAWDSIVSEYESMVDSIKNAVEQLNNISTGGGDIMGSIQEQINGLIDQLREEANKSVCTRAKDLGINSYASEVMWDVIDQRFGFDEEAYNDGTKTVIHEIIKDQSRQSDGELVGLFEQMGVKDEGEGLVDFFAKAGVESDGITDEGNDIVNDNVDDQIGDVADDLFGDSDNPFDNTTDDITGDVQDNADID